MKKEVKQIFLALAFFAFSAGLFYNFEELWMAENNLSTSTIGTVLSLASIITVSVIYLSTSLVKSNKLKSFACFLLIVKGILLFLLFLLNGTGLNFFIKFIIMLEWAIDTEIYACIYPLITYITKDDKLYAKRGLTYDAMYYLAVIFVGIFLGKTIFNYTVSYNTYVLLASIFLFLSYFVLRKVNIDTSKDDNNNKTFSDIVKKLRHDKPSLYYLAGLFIGNFSYYGITGLYMIILTTNLNFAPAVASNIKLVAGIIGVFLGTLVLNKFTFKNDYLNVFIKYGVRMISYILVLLTNSDILIFLSFLYMMLSSSSYTHIIDAPYINRYSGKDQLIFCNLREMTSYLGRAVGTFLCGVCITISIRLNFAVALVFIIIQFIFWYLAIYYRRKENDRQ